MGPPDQRPRGQGKGISPRPPAGHDEPMFISAVDQDTATGPVPDYYSALRARGGFLPNSALAFSPRPDVAGAWGALNAAVRDGMDRRRFEIVTVAAAQARRSTYCAGAHAVFLQDAAGDPASVAAIADDLSGASLPPQDRAVYEFAVKVAADAASVEQEDVDRLRTAGLSDSDVADVVMAAAARCFFTAVLDGLGTQLDRQTAERLAPEHLAALVVGRPVADQPSPA